MIQLSLTWGAQLWELTVATVVVVGECLLVAGGEGTAHAGLFSSERCPLPTACSFGSAVVLKEA